MNLNFKNVNTFSENKYFIYSRLTTLQIRKHTAMLEYLSIVAGINQHKVQG